MIEIELGRKIVTLTGPDDRDRLKDLSSSSSAKFLADLLAEVAETSVGMARELLAEGKYDEARAENAYAEALEGVAQFLRVGIKEAVKENS